MNTEIISQDVAVPALPDPSTLVPSGTNREHAESSTKAPKAKQLTHEIKETLISRLMLCKDGVTGKALAAEFGVSPSTVTKLKRVAEWRIKVQRQEEREKQQQIKGSKAKHREQLIKLQSQCLPIEMVIDPTALENLEDDIAQAREELAHRVADAITSAFTKLAEHKADIEELRAEFKQLKPDETIMGCTSWTQFCQNVLHRSIRSVQYMLTGGNPNNKKKKTREIISPGNDAETDGDCATSPEGTPDIYQTHRRRVLKTLVIVSELTEAYKHSHAWEHLIKELANLAFTPAEIEQMREYATTAAA